LGVVVLPSAELDGGLATAVREAAAVATTVQAFENDLAVWVRAGPGVCCALCVVSVRSVFCVLVGGGWTLARVDRWSVAQSRGRPAAGREQVDQSPGAWRRALEPEWAAAAMPGAALPPQERRAHEAELRAINSAQQRQREWQERLRAAAQVGERKRLVELLDEAPAGMAAERVDSRDVRGRSAAWLAAAAGQLGALEELVFAGAHVDLEDGDGTTALWAACRAGRTAVVRALLELGANAEKLHARDHASPLLACCLGSHLDSAAALLDHGVPTPLWAAPLLRPVFCGEQPSPPPQGSRTWTRGRARRE
jgi:hypothetical protein